MAESEVIDIVPTSETLHGHTDNALPTTADTPLQVSQSKEQEDGLSTAGTNSSELILHTSIRYVSAQRCVHLMIHSLSTGNKQMSDPVFVM